MKFFHVAILSLATAPLASAWLLAPAFFPETKSILQRHDEMMKEFFEKPSFLTFKSSVDLPRYELVNNDEKFELAVHVPKGMTTDDLHVELHKDGYLTVHGQIEQETKDDEGLTTSKRSESFSQSFLLDPTVVMDELKANFVDEEDAVLKIAAPKDVKLLEAKEEKIHKVPISTAKAMTGTEKKNVVADDTLDDCDVEV